MRASAIPVILVLVLAGLAVAGYSLPGQRRVIERLSIVERTLSEQREAGSIRDEHRRQDNQWFNLLLRAQESPWVGSAGAPVQCRLAVEADVLRQSEPVRVLAEVRNVSDQVQTVGGMLFEPLTLKLLHEGQEAKYVGPWHSAPPPLPVTLPPGRIMREMVTLTREQFAELASSGRFEVEWTYTSGAYPPKVTWAGKLPPARVEWHAQ